VLFRSRGRALRRGGHGIGLQYFQCGLQLLLRSYSRRIPRELGQYAVQHIEVKEVWNDVPNWPAKHIGKSQLSMAGMAVPALPKCHLLPSIILACDHGVRAVVEQYAMFGPLVGLDLSCARHV